MSHKTTNEAKISGNLMNRWFSIDDQLDQRIAFVVIPLTAAAIILILGLVFNISEARWFGGGSLYSLILVRALEHRHRLRWKKLASIQKQNLNLQLTPAKTREEVDFQWRIGDRLAS